MKLILFLCLHSYIIFAQVYQVNNGKIVLKARSVLIGIEDEFDAVGNGLSGTINLNDKTFNLSYDLWNLDTGIQLRNEHMHTNYLETEDFPMVSFVGKIISVTNARMEIEGTFSLHGVSKQLNVEAKWNAKEIIAEWTLKLSDYGIEIPSKFFIARLQEQLTMTVNIKLN